MPINKPSSTTSPTTPRTQRQGPATLPNRRLKSIQLKEIILFITAVAMASFSLLSDASPLRLEIQAPPLNSRQVRAHPERPDLFANVEENGETSLWQLKPSGAATRVLTLPVEATAVQLIVAHGEPFDTRIVVGTHYGEIKVFNSSGQLLCSGRNQSTGDILSLVVAPNPSLILGADRSGSVSIWTSQCAFQRQIAKTQQVVGLAMIPNQSRALAAWQDGTLVGIDLSASKADKSVTLTHGVSYDDGIRALAISRDGERLAIVFNGAVRVFLTSEIVSELGKAHSAHVQASTPMDFTVDSERLAFAPSGDYLIRADFHEILVWNMRTDQPFRQVVAAYAAQTLAFSADGIRMVTGADNSAPRVWEFGYAPVGPPVRVADSRIASIAISDSNEIFVAATKGNLFKLSPEGLPESESSGLTDQVFTMDASPDGQTVITAGRGVSLDVFKGTENKGDSVTAGRAFLSQPIDNNFYNHQFGSIRFLPDGERFVATSSWNFVEMWRRGQHDPILEIPIKLHQHQSPMDLAISKNGQLIAIALSGASDDNFDQRDAPEILILGTDGHLVSRMSDLKARRLIDHIAFLDDDGKELVATSTDGEIQRWSTEQGKPIDEPIVSPDFKAPIGVAPIQKGGALVAAFPDGSLGLVKLKSLENTFLRSSMNDDFALMRDTSVMSISHDESLIVTGSAAGAITVWRPGLRLVLQFPSQEVETHSPGLLTQGMPPLFCGVAQSTLLCWSTDHDPVPPYDSTQLGMADSGDLHRGRQLLATSRENGNVLVSSLQDPSSQVVAEAQEMTGWVRWSVDGSHLYLVGSLPEFDHILHTFDVPSSDFRQATSLVIQKFDERIGSITALQDGRIAVELGRRIAVFRSSADAVESLPIPDECSRNLRFLPILFSADAKRAVISCDERAIGLKQVAGKWNEEFSSSYWSTATALCYDPTEKLFISGHSTGEVRVWDAHSGRLIRYLPFGRAVVSVGVSGDTVTVASADGQFSYYSLHTGELLGRSVASRGGITTVTSTGWHSSVGSSVYGVVGFDRQGRVAEELVAARFSSAVVVRDLFGRDRLWARLTAALTHALQSLGEWFGNKSWYEQLGTVVSATYVMFALALGIIWVVRPAILSSWTFRLSTNPSIQSAKDSAE